MNSQSPISLLQVFNSGKPCGWLGKSATGYWFHYGSNSPNQQWVSLLMPPTTNFYQQADLFPVFAQHISTQQEPLTQLQQLNGQQMGSLSFANPDNPVVRPLLRTPPPLAPGQRALVATQTRRPFADTVVQHTSTWPLIQILREIKKKVDPNNRLHALNWTLQAENTGEWIQHPRPDMDIYRQHLYGLETIQAVLNMNKDSFQALIKQHKKLMLVFLEVARTYCKHFAAEVELMKDLIPLIEEGQLDVSLSYLQANHMSHPFVCGINYFPT